MQDSLKLTIIRPNCAQRVKLAVVNSTTVFFGCCCIFTSKNYITLDVKYRMVTHRLMMMARETEMVTSRPVLRPGRWWPPPPGPSLSTASVDTADTPSFSAPAVGHYDRRRPVRWRLPGPSHGASLGVGRMATVGTGLQITSASTLCPSSMTGQR